MSRLTQTFEMLRVMVEQGKVDLINENFPVGFTISTSGNILLKFSLDDPIRCKSFDEVVELVSDYVD